jgi:hypothetical protein
MKLLLSTVALGSLIALGACTTAQQSTVTTGITTVQTNAQKVITGYDNAKTIAAAMVVLYPQYGAAVAMVEAKADPIVAELTPLVSDANADAATVEALIGTLQGQLTALTTAIKPAAVTAAATK